MRALAGAGTFDLLVYTASDAAVPTEWYALVIQAYKQAPADVWDAPHAWLPMLS